ncbi:Major facilitator superfamily (MFS) profile domain-containing protein [Tsukamurella ocularis]|uniref:MFS transporter n=1 Tax=Tsukamurella ocularis TaxID=1970234 RepID=UPI0039F013D4
MSTNTMADQPATPQQQDQHRSSTAWFVVIMLMCCVMINWADKAVFGLIAQPIAKELGLSASDLGFMSSAFFFLFTVTGLGVSLIADRIKIKWALLILVVIWSAVQMPLVFMASAGVLLATRIGLGAAEGPAGGLTQAAAFQWFPKEKRALPSALLIAGTGLSKIVIAPFLAVLIVNHGWRSAIVALAVIGGVWCVLWFFIGKQGPFSTAGVPRAEERAVGDADAAPGASGSAADDLRVPMWAILRTRTVLAAVVGAFALNAMATVVLTWLPSYFEVGLGFTRVQAGTLFGLPSLVAIAAGVLGGWLTDRLLSRGGSSRVLRSLVAATGLGVGGVLLVLLPYVDGKWAPVTLLVFGYGLASLATPLLFASVSHVAPGARQASVLTMFTALYSTAGVIAPWLTGVIVDAVGSAGRGYAVAFQLVGVTILLGGALVALIADPERDAKKIEELARR